MKLLGLLGGIGPHSTATYYNRLNELMNEKYGGYTSSNLMLYSFNFEDIMRRIHLNEWNEIEKLMLSAALKLQNAGSDYILICSNTLHKTYNYVKTRIEIPLIHILDPIVNIINQDNLQKIAIIGTKITMNERFYVDYLNKHTAVSCIELEQNDKEIIDNMIFDELCHNIISKTTKAKILGIVDKLHEQGAEAVVLGCTEIGLLINESDFSNGMLILDTTKQHVNFTIENYF